MKKTSRGETLNKRNRVESVDRDRLEDDRAIRWQDYRGAWRAIDPCGGDEATMTAELSVPIRRKP